MDREFTHETRVGPPPTHPPRPLLDPAHGRSRERTLPVCPDSTSGFEGDFMIAETVRTFRDAGLGIKILGGPIQPASPGIFQLDIHRSRTGEYFRIWAGAKDTEFAIVDRDRDFRQVVLRVQEPRRGFVQVVPWTWGSREWMLRRLQAEGVRILRESRRQFVVERWTSEVEHRYLCGFDEQRLFIAEIPRGGTVAEAHAALMPDEVRRGPGPVPRQGEWFFLPVQAQEGRDLEVYAESHRRSLRRQEPIAVGSQPHVADQLLRVDGRERADARWGRELERYVRGAVRHVDHRTVVLMGWHRVLRNRAVIPASGTDARLKWID